MSKHLIIVESAKKAKTIRGILGRAFTVKATSGHLLEMPRDDLHVDLKTFQPTLHLIRGKGKQLQALKKAAAQADKVYLATDLDREGEAIAQHVVERLGRGVAQRAQRIAFTAITEADLKAALASPRTIDQNLVEAQVARRVIDRLVGYMVSPVLWAGLSGQKGLSAGRVQSPALWLVVQRERVIRDFVAEEWWSVDAELSKKHEADAALPAQDMQKFWARLVLIHGKKPALKNAEAAHKIKQALETADWQVAAVKKGQRRRYPYPPFTTDSLQQAASSQLGMTPKTTMSLAQQLYEGLDVGEGKAVGLITYLRTDSVAVVPEAQQAAREVVTRYWGANYLPPRPPTYTTHDKTAQEAHEAIRPTDPKRTPKQIESYLSPQQYQLYRLIWRRFIASQMRAAEYDTMTVDIATFDAAQRPTPYLFLATGRSLRFAGFLKVYGVDEDAEVARTISGKDTKGKNDKNDKTGQKDDAETGLDNPALPDLKPGDWLDLHQLVPKQHFTKPPARYTEAGLIGELKKQGLGRPSTYATIIETLKYRRYVQVQQKRLHPTPLGCQVCELLETHVDTVVDVAFTARMEADLDAIARGDVSRLATMQEFYEPFHAVIEKALAAARLNRQPAAQTPYKGSSTRRRQGKKSSRTKSARAGTTRSGKGSRARKSARSGRSDQALPESDRAGQACPLCGQGQLSLRSGRFGPFLGCSRYGEGCKYTENLSTTVTQQPKKRKKD